MLVAKADYALFSKLSSSVHLVDFDFGTSLAFFSCIL